MKDDEEPKEPSFSSEIKKEGAKSLSGAAAELLLRAGGPAADEIGIYLADNFHAWRWRKENAEKVGEKHIETAKRRGINEDHLQPLPEGDFYRAMEACSLEDNDTVQQLWAGLLTSAMDPNNPAKSSKAFIDILKSIGPVETGLLIVLHALDVIPNYPKRGMATAANDSIEKAIFRFEKFAEKAWRHFPHNEQEVAVQNLMRLRCVGYRTGKRYVTSKLMKSSPTRVPEHELVLRAQPVAQAMDHLENLALAASGTGKVPAWLEVGPYGSPPREAHYELTTLGKSLVHACIAEDELKIFEES